MALSPNGTHQITSGISPNTMYYLALYALVLIVRFFKLKKETNNQWTSVDSKRVFHVALEVVYTASGLVVLLLEDLHAYAPFIIVSYMMLMYLSSQMESIHEKFSENTVFFTHLAILVFVAALTCWYFESVQKNNQLQIANAESQYRVAIPYTDLGLRQHLGNSAGNMTLVFVTTVNASNDLTAKTKAKDLMTTKVTPFTSKAIRQTDGSIIIHDDLTVASQISK